MSLSANALVKTKGPSEQDRVLLTAGVTYYKGSIVNITAAGGLAIKAGDVANQGSLSGVLTEGAIVASGETKYVSMERGRVWIPFAAAAQADVGDYVYATADDTIAKSATNADPCGKVVDVEVGVALCVDFRLGIPKTALA
jgi:hypothetical protein